jgi:tetratricopeptide (TPR) repeat protein
MLLIGILVASAATILWFCRSSTALPTPPAVPVDPTEPDVAAFIEQSRQRVLKEPRSAQAWGTLGQVFLANEMEDESLLCFAEAERLDPSNPRWPYYQGGVSLNRGNRAVALPYLQQAVERGAVAEPDNRVPRLLLAETLLAVGRVEDAEEHLRQVLARQPNDPRTHFDLALLASVRQDWSDSKSHLQHCLGSPFVRQKAHVQLAAIGQRLGDEAEAEQYRRQADRLPADQEWNDPFVSDYLRWAVKKRSRYRLAESLEGAGRLQEAVAALQPLLEHYPDDYLPRITVGKFFGQMGENRRAAVVLREAIRLAPEKVQAHYYLSLVLFAEAEKLTRKGDEGEAARSLYREAVESARRLLAIKPDYGFAYMPLGVSLKRLGQRGEALAALRQAVRCNPEYAELHFHLGEILAEEGQASESREQLERAVQMAEPHARWLPSVRARLAALGSNTTPKKTRDKPHE